MIDLERRSGLLEGQRVDVPIRPERLGVIGSPPRPGADPRLELDVEARVNHGDSVPLLGTTHGHPLRVRVPFGDADGVVEGATVAIAWTPRDVHVIATPRD